MLTEGRSGSNWLGSLANSTGLMGNLEEWVDQSRLGSRVGSLTRDLFLKKIISLSSTNNERYAIKIFPRHLQEVQHALGFDLIKLLQTEFDASLVILKRRDRLRQAISYTKARRSGKWRSSDSEKKKHEYDFNLICRYYFYIERSYNYWDTYLKIREVDYAEFTYEDLLTNPQPYLAYVAKALDVSEPSNAKTNLHIQRDDETEQWIERFRSDLVSNNIIDPSMLYIPPNRTFENIKRFWKKELMTPLNI